MNQITPWHSDSGKFTRSRTRWENPRPSGLGELGKFSTKNLVRKNWGRTQQVPDPKLDTSFLERKQLVINGDVESNPGPIQSIQACRAANGRLYYKSLLLKYIDTCSCQACEEYVCDDTKDSSVLNEIEFCSVVCDDFSLKNHQKIKNKRNTTLENEKFISKIDVIDLKVHDLSFLKLSELLKDADVESNPGPTPNPGTPKGRKAKNRNFNFTANKLHYDGRNRTKRANLPSQAICIGSKG